MYDGSAAAQTRRMTATDAFLGKDCTDPMDHVPMDRTDHLHHTKRTDPSMRAAGCRTRLTTHDERDDKGQNATRDGDGCVPPGSPTVMHGRKKTSKTNRNKVSNKVPPQESAKRLDADKDEQSCLLENTLLTTLFEQSCPNKDPALFEQCCEQAANNVPTRRRHAIIHACRQRRLRRSSSPGASKVRTKSEQATNKRADKRRIETVSNPISG